MSQDLFAAFGDAVPRAGVQPQPATQAHTKASEPENEIAQIDEDDDFGDFEDAAGPPARPVDSQTRVLEVESNKLPQTRDEITAKAPKPLPFSPRDPMMQATGRHPFADHMDILFSADEDEYTAGQDEWNDLSNNPEAAMAYSKRVIQEQMEAEARAAELKAERETAIKSGIVTTQTKAPRSPATTQSKAPRDPNVLFDVEDPSEGEASDHNDGDDWGEFEDTTVAPSPITKHKASARDNIDLLGIDDALPSVPAKPSAKPHARGPSRSKAAPLAVSITPDDPWDDFEVVGQQTATAPSRMPLPDVPPSNIPPPSVLLSHLGASLKVTATPDVIPGLVDTAYVLAHVLVGRKLRWKRSATLAASMRIGPAVAGGKSGMKLTGVDRGEVAKEDREAAEAVTTWRARVGKLRTAVTSYNQSSVLPTKRLPELAQAMPIKSLKHMEGGLGAPHECTLCGLKREERVLRVDENIEDSFGEWWLENASMHTVCAAWWMQNEVVLRSR